MTTQEKLLANKKQFIRKEIMRFRVRDKLREQQLIQNLSTHFTSMFGTAKLVAGYYALKNEININLFLDHLRTNEYHVSLPRIVSKNLHLNFHTYNDKNELALNPNYKFYEPLVDSSQIIPNIIIVPILAYDNLKNRLGYGGGFYDRTLSYYNKAISVGIAFTNQKIKNVPINQFDVQLDYIFTEEGIIK